MLITYSNPFSAIEFHAVGRDELPPDWSAESEALGLFLMEDIAAFLTTTDENYSLSVVSELEFDHLTSTGMLHGASVPFRSGDAVLRIRGGSDVDIPMAGPTLGLKVVELVNLRILVCPVLEGTVNFEVLKPFRR